jgi:hypothetical protein
MGRTLTNRQSVALVVQKFHFTTAPRPAEPPSVEVVGRMQGIIAFLLTLIGFSPVTRLSVTGSELRWQVKSLWGEESQYVPLRSISSLKSGVKKPYAALVLCAIIVWVGIVITIESGIWISIVPALVIASVCVVYYVFTKRFFISIHPHGGPAIHLVFVPNVIEGVPINPQQAVAVVGVIRDMILSKGTSVRPPLPPLPVEALPAFEEIQAEFWEAPEAESAPPPIIEAEEVVEEEDAEQKASKAYSHAKKLAQTGEQQLAIEVLRDIMRRFPETDAAQKARRNLERAGVGV